MAAKQVSGDGGLAGMSKSQLYDIMSQMKTLIEQNRQQARQILVQNPPLTRALFQAQIMLGMVQSPLVTPSTPSTLPNSQPSSVPAQQSSIQPPPQVGPNQIRKQQTSQTTTSNHQSQPVPRNPLPQSKPISPPNSQPQPMSYHPSHPSHQPSKPLTSQQPSLIPITQSSQIPSTQLPQHSTSSQPLLHHQLPMPSLSTQSQQPMQNIGGQYFPLQPPLPPQARPHMPTFPHHMHAQMGPNSDFQHPSGQQMHPSQHMYNSGTRPPTGMGPSFQQGQLPHSNQAMPPSVYQAGGQHFGMEFKVGSSSQPDRGSNWMSGAPENALGSSSQLQGPPSFAGQMGPGNQLPARPPTMSPDMEKALLQQVMSLTPEQINMLPTEQRNQILQLQQMLRQ